MVILVVGRYRSVVILSVGMYRGSGNIGGEGLGIGSVVDIGGGN